MIRYFLIIVLLCNGINIIAQHQTTARLKIESGGSVEFIFNTFYEYNNGITYTDWTKLSVYFIDTIAGVPTAMQWKLDVRAMDTDIRGFANNLDLETIEFEVNGDAGPTYSAVPLQLKNFDQSLVTNGPQTDLVTPVLTNVFVTYHCGKSLLAPNNLLGKPADYYGVDIVFTLLED